MLTSVYGNEMYVQSEYKKIIQNPKYMYWNFGTFWDQEIGIPENTYNTIGFVSVVKQEIMDKILGYFALEVNRDSNIVTEMSCINFGDINITFSKDFYKLIEKVFVEFKFDKLHFKVIVGNPAEKIYDKFIKRCGGEISGYFKHHVKLQDGNIYDVKHYDIFREDYLKNIKWKL